MTAALPPPSGRIPSSGCRSRGSPGPAPVGGRATTRGDRLIGSLERPVVRRLITFGAIGVVSTAACALLYAFLRGHAPAAVSNVVALVVTAVGNTAANRRLTFGVRGRESVIRDQLAGLFALCVALAITTASVVYSSVAPDAGRAVELRSCSRPTRSRPSAASSCSPRGSRSDRPLTDPLDSPS